MSESYGYVLETGEVAIEGDSARARQRCACRGDVPGRGRKHCERSLSATPTRRRLPMRTPGARRVAGKYRILALAAALVGAVLFILTWVPYFGAHRAATESETVFAYFAESLGEAELCQKISWAAFQRYSVYVRRRRGLLRALRLL